MPVQPRTLSAVPLFPLPDFFLYPGVVAPLHIFETRYRQMIEDLLDGPGRLVTAAYRPDGPRGEHGPVTLPVGTLAEIVQHEKLDDGRFILMIAAVARVKLQEVPSERLYRLVDAIVVPDDRRSDLAAAELRPRIIDALEVRAETDGPVPDGVTSRTGNGWPPGRGTLPAGSRDPGGHLPRRRGPRSGSSGGATGLACRCSPA